MNGFSYEDAGFAVMTWIAVPGVMSCFLPSPSTAYDKSSGQIASSAESVKMLRRDEILGTAVGLGIALGATLLVAPRVGGRAALVFVGAVVILGLFLYEYERAIRLGKAAAQTAGTT